MYAVYCRKCSWQLGINSNASQKEFAGQWEIIFKRKSLKISFGKNLSLKFCKNARFIKAFPGFHQNIYHVFESAQFVQSPLLFTVKQTHKANDFFRWINIFLGRYFRNILTLCCPKRKKSLGDCFCGKTWYWLKWFLHLIPPKIDVVLVRLDVFLWEEERLFWMTLFFFFCY